MLFEAMGILKEDIGDMFKALLEGQNYIKSELLFIKEDILKLKSSAADNKKERNENIKKNVDNGEKAKAKEHKKKPVAEQSNYDNDDKTKESYASKASSQPKQKPLPHKKQQEEVPYSPCNILMVGDSHLNNLEIRVLEQETNTRVNKATAFTVDEDIDAKYPKKNFIRIVPDRLSNKSYDTLILQGGCNEISNINLSNGVSASILEEKVKMSRTKMFQLAQSSLRNNPKLKKVIIVKSLPRYDPLNLDQHSVKSKLNQFGNTLYDTLWMSNGCPENILIAD